MPVDIRSSDFLGCPTDDIPSFIKEKGGVIGVVGYGYVGRAVHHYFRDACSVLVYDIKGSVNTLREVVESSNVIFVAVPTPMKQDGSCHTDIVEDVVARIRAESLDIGRPLDAFVVVLKSTVPPGFTDRLRKKHLDMRIAFSPEFLTEKNAIEDFRTCNRIIVAGSDDDTDVVFRFFFSVCHEQAVLGKVMLYAEPDPTTAELGKLMSNAFLATKVIFCNEIERISEKLGLDYDAVRAIAALDPRIGPSHTMVPGPDGRNGFGGHCFPKDLANLVHVAKQCGAEEKLLTAVSERNVELRGEKDWERMEGRAVIKE